MIFSFFVRYILSMIRLSISQVSLFSLYYAKYYNNIYVIKFYLPIKHIVSCLVAQAKISNLAVFELLCCSLRTPTFPIPNGYSCYLTLGISMVLINTRPLKIYTRTGSLLEWIDNCCGDKKIFLRAFTLSPKNVCNPWLYLLLVKY